MAATNQPANPFALNNKRIIRSEPNEYDKATIVSIYPRVIKEKKETIFPGVFEIPAGSVEKPAVLVIGPSSWFRDMGEEMPSIEIPNNAVQVANSIVTDYCNGLIEYDKEGGPGLFFIPGAWTLKEILDKYKIEFDRAVKKQRVWFERLVRLGDKGWAETNGSPRAVNELMKMAAAELGVKDKDWMRSTIVSEMIKCILCGNLRNPGFPICGSCNRVVDHDLAKKRGLVETATNSK